MQKPLVLGTFVLACLPLALVRGALTLTVSAVMIGIPDPNASRGRLIVAASIESSSPNLADGQAVFEDDVRILVSGQSRDGVVESLHDEVYRVLAPVSRRGHVVYDVAVVVPLRPESPPSQLHVASATTRLEAVVRLRVDSLKTAGAVLLGGPWISRATRSPGPFVRHGEAAVLLPLPPVSRLAFGLHEKLRVSSLVSSTAGRGIEPYVATSVRSAASGRLVLVPETRCVPARSTAAVLSCAALLDWPSDIAVGRYTLRVSANLGGEEAHRDLVMELR